MKKKGSISKLWILVGVSVLTLFVLIILSAVLNVGDRLSSVRITEYNIPILSIAFYVFSFVLFFFLILNPLRIILFSKNYSIDTMLDNPDKYVSVRRTLAKNTLKNELLKDKQEQQDKIRMALDSNDDEVLRNALNDVYNSTIKKEMNKIIIKNAKTMMISTAISQNSKLDMITVFTVNLKMIKELVLAAGFRPSLPKLGKLSARILLTALIAEGLEDKINITSLLPQSVGKTFEKVPFLGTVAESVVQGTANALLCLRVGIVTRKYLFADSNIKTKTDIKLEAIKESVILLPSVVGEFTKSLGKSVVDKVKDACDGVVNAVLFIPKAISKASKNNQDDIENLAIENN